MLICSSVRYYTWPRSLSTPGMSHSKWTYMSPDVSCVLAYGFYVTSHWIYRILCVFYWNSKIELLFGGINLRTPIPVAAPSQACVCGSSLAGIAGSIRVGDMDVCLLWVLCVCQVEVFASGWSFVQRSPTECGVSEYNREAWIMRRFWPIRGYCAMGGGIIKLLYITNIKCFTAVIRTDVMIQFDITASSRSAHDMPGQTQMGQGGHSSNPFETRH